MISPIPSHPQTAGNRTRIFSLGKAIKELGHDFYFAHAEREIGDRKAMAQCWGREYFCQLSYARRNPLFFRIKRKLKSFFDSEAYLKRDIDIWYDPGINGHLKRLYQRYEFDVIIAEYVFFSKALLCFPTRVLKLIDTHDVFSLRHKKYIKKNLKYTWFSTSPAQEKKGLRRADNIIAIQDAEATYFRKLTGKPTVTVGHMTNTVAPIKSHNKSSNILFIGSSNQSNIDAINFFIEKVFPTIKRVVPESNILMVGNICRTFDGNIQWIEKLGVMDDLAPAYQRADVVVNPISTGTGLKIKNIEALGYGKPLVTTSVGAVGLESGSRTAFLVADTAQDFANAVIGILQHPSIKLQFSNKAFQFAEAWNRKQIEALGLIIDSNYHCINR